VRPIAVAATASRYPSPASRRLPVDTMNAAAMIKDRNMRFYLHDLDRIVAQAQPSNNIECNQEISLVSIDLFLVGAII
jgi:hypothetical protein